MVRERRLVSRYFHVAMIHLALKQYVNIINYSSADGWRVTVLSYRDSSDKVTFTSYVDGWSPTV